MKVSELKRKTDNQEIKKIINYFGKIRDYRCQMFLIPPEANIEDIYHAIQDVFVSRYEECNKEKQTLEFEEYIRQEKIQLNHFARELDSIGYKSCNTDKWKIGTIYENDYYARIAIQERYKSIRWIYDVIGYQPKYKYDFLNYIAKRNDLYLIFETAFKNIEKNKLNSKQVVDVLYKKYGKEAMDNIEDGVLNDRIRSSIMRSLSYIKYHDPFYWANINHVKDYFMLCTTQKNPKD